MRVVDTFSLTLGQGLLVLAAAEEAAAGAGMDELVANTQSRIPRTRIYGVSAASSTSSGAVASGGPRPCWDPSSTSSR